MRKKCKTIYFCRLRKPGCPVILLPIYWKNFRCNHGVTKNHYFVHKTKYFSVSSKCEQLLYLTPFQIRSFLVGRIWTVMSRENISRQIGWLWNGAMNNRIAFAKAPNEWTADQSSTICVDVERPDRHCGDDLAAVVSYRNDGKDNRNATYIVISNQFRQVFKRNAIYGLTASRLIPR